MFIQFNEIVNVAKFIDYEMIAMKQNSIVLLFSSIHFRFCSRLIV